MHRCAYFTILLYFDIRIHPCSCILVLVCSCAIVFLYAYIIFYSSISMPLHYSAIILLYCSIAIWPFPVSPLPKAIKQVTTETKWQQPPLSGSKIQCKMQCFPMPQTIGLCTGNYGLCTGGVGGGLLPFCFLGELPPHILT